MSVSIYAYCLLKYMVATKTETKSSNQCDRFCLVKSMSASRPEDVLILEVLDLKNIVLVIFTASRPLLLRS